MSHLQDEGPTARDLMVRYSTGKKTSKNKKKLEKAMKVLKVFWLFSIFWMHQLKFIVCGGCSEM